MATKRRKIAQSTDNEEDGEDEVFILKHKNTALADQFFLQKGEINRLKEENAKLRIENQHRDAYVQILSNRLGNLRDSIDLLKSSISPPTDSSSYNIYESYIQALESSVDEDYSMIGDIEIDKYEGTVDVKTDTNKFESELTNQFNWVNDTIKEFISLLSNSSLSKEEVIEAQNQELDRVNTSLQNYKHIKRECDNKYNSLLHKYNTLSKDLLSLERKLHNYELEILNYKNNPNYNNNNSNTTLVKEENTMSIKQENNISSSSSSSITESQSNPIPPPPPYSSSSSASSSSPKTLSTSCDPEEINDINELRQMLKDKDLRYEKSQENFEKLVARINELQYQYDTIIITNTDGGENSGNSNNNNNNSENNNINNINNNGSVRINPKIVALETKVKEYEKQIADLNKQVAEFKEIKVEKDEEIMYEKSNYKNVISELSKRYDNELSRITNERVKLHEQIKSLKDQVKEYQDKENEREISSKTFKYYEEVVSNLTMQLENANKLNQDLQNNMNDHPDEETLLKQIDILNAQLVQLTDQNKSLLSQIRSKDLYVGKLTSDKLNNENAKIELMREKEMLTKQIQEIKKNEDLRQTLINDYKAKDNANERYKKEMDQENESLKDEKQKLKSELTDIQSKYKELLVKSESCELSNKEMFSKITELTTALESCKKKKRKLEDDIKVFKRRLESNGLNAELVDSEELESLKLENMDMKTAIMCSVCHDRRKNCIIVKCGHMFCSECIENNLKARNRKCPKCNCQYGQEDFKSAWLV